MARKLLYLLLPFMFLLFNSVQAQRITVTDLKYGLTHTLGNTEDYFLKKGFTFAGSNELSDLSPIPIDHSFNKYNYTSNYINVSIVELEGRVYECSNTTLKQSEFLFLRNQVKDLGFVLVSSDSDGDVLTSIYVKGSYKVDFTVSKTSDDSKMYRTSIRHVSKRHNVNIN